MNNSNDIEGAAKDNTTWLERWCVSLAMIALVILCILVTVSVVSRWFGFSFIPDYVLLVRELMLFVILFPIAAVTAQRGHIAVTFFTERVSSRNVKVLNIVAHSVGFFFAGMLLWSASKLFTSALYSKEYYDGDIYLPMWIGYSIFTFGLALFFFRLFFVLIEDIKSFIKH